MQCLEDDLHVEVTTELRALTVIRKIYVHVWWELINACRVQSSRTHLLPVSCLKVVQLLLMVKPDKRSLPGVFSIHLCPLAMEGLKMSQLKLFELGKIIEDIKIACMYTSATLTKRNLPSAFTYKLYLNDTIQSSICYGLNQKCA